MVKYSNLSDEFIVNCIAHKPYKMLNIEWIKSITNYPEKVIFRALERTHEHGYLEYGVSLNSAWITKEGRKLLW